MGRFSNFVNKFGFTSGQSTEENFWRKTNFGWKLSLKEKEFCILMTKTIYKRALIDTLKNFDFDKNDNLETLILNYFLNYNQKSLKLRSIMDYIANAIARREKLYLIYNGSLKEKLEKAMEFSIRLATVDEQKIMDQKINENEVLPKGQFIFDGSVVEEAVLITLLNSELYNIIASTNSQLGASSCPVFKVKDMTRNISLSDSEVAKQQGTEVKEGIKSGEGAMIDSDSDIVLLEPNTSSQQTALKSYEETLSLVSGLPSQWISGQSTSGSYNGGSSDTEAIERAMSTLKLQILDPICFGLFRRMFKFKRNKYTYLYKMNGLISAISQVTQLDNKEKRRAILDILP